MYKLTRKNSPNKGYPDGAKGGNKPKKIIIHHWGVDGQKFDNVVGWLCNPKAGVSAHYVVEAGKVVKLMSDTDCAWHAGSKAQNTTSIGIECRPECTKADRETVIELIAYLYAKHGVLPIVGHKDVSATSCPGRWYKYLSTIKREATAKYKSNASTNTSNASTNKSNASTNTSNASTNKSNASTKKSLEEVAKEVTQGKWGNGEERKKKLKAAGYNYEKVQAKVNELKKPAKKTIEQIAKEVIQGKWGNGEERKNKLIKAGYDPYAVQKKVNQLLK